MAAASIAADRLLAPRHRKLLDNRAISEQVASERGCYTEPISPNLAALGFGPRQRRPGFVIPLHSVRGTIGGYQLRPDEPRSVKGKIAKYETCQATAPGQPGFAMMIDVPPKCRPTLGDPKIPLWVTEGVLKADAAASAGLCCIDLLGVWNWRGTNEQGGKTALADWELIALNGRLVYLAFDSDLLQKHQVRAALLRLKALLESRGAIVKIVLLPAGENGAKVGIDDYLAAGHTTDELRALAVDRLPAEMDDSEREAGPYVANKKGLYIAKPDGELMPIASCWAEITALRQCHDGAEVAREYEITAHRGEETRIVSTPAAKFSSLAWLPELPPRFNIHAGAAAKDRFRDATQRLSADDLPEVIIYRAPGWHRINGSWGYIHNAGVIGLDATVQVELIDELAPFVLPAPPDGDELVVAVRAALDLMHFGPGRLAAPLFGATWRSLIKEVDFSIWLHGPTGCFKTERANVTIQHLGSGFTAQTPYASWFIDTANALNEKLFMMKDGPALFDDYRPSPSTAERVRQQQVIDRILRSAGNRAGRGRLGSNLKLVSGRPPRCLAICTAEDLPMGESTKGRALCLEVRHGDFAKDHLTRFQRLGVDGRLVAATSAFLSWLAPRRDQVLGGWYNKFVECRDRATQGDQHARFPGVVADLYLGAQLFFTFAVDARALQEYEAELSLQTIWGGLLEAGAQQQVLQQGDRPEVRFIELLKSAVASGGAHLAGRDGGPPLGPGESIPERERESTGWGWRYNNGSYIPMGIRAGWVDIGKSEVYLDPAASYKAAGLMAADGNGISVSSPTLNKRLKEAGLLLRTDPKRKTITHRESLQGGRPDVLVLRLTTFRPEIELETDDDADQD